MASSSNLLQSVCGNKSFKSPLSTTILFKTFCFYAVESASGDTFIVANHEKSSEGQLSDGLLSGITILGLVATLLAIAVVLMVVYIRYSTIKKPQNQDKIPLITSDQ